MNEKTKFNADYKSVTVFEILDDLAKQYQFSYNIKGREIIVFEKKSTPVKSNKTVKGKVTDIDGLSIPGATVLEKGTSNGTMTDFDGSYTITVKTENAELVFSFIGYSSETVLVGTQTTINMTMLEDIMSLGEVVIVGYGTQKKETVTGSIASVSGDELVDVPIASATNSLAGRMSGLVSKQESGRPGNDAAMLSIRGFGNALTIVDGVEADINSDFLT